MEHHHHPPHHLHGHSSRYAPLPPQPPPPATVFLDPPDPYRRPPHVSFPPQPPPGALPSPSAVHHHRPDTGGGLIYVSYAPSSSHHSDHGRFLPPPDPALERLLLKPPHPPVPALRVSERIIFPDGHPEAPRMQHHPIRRSSGGEEVFVREDFKRERVRVFSDGRQGGIPLYGRREVEAMEFGEQEDVARRLGFLGRKRPRCEEGRVLGEDTSLEFFEGRDPRRLSSGAGASRRRSEVLLYDPRGGNSESSRGSTSMYASERGEAMVAIPRLSAGTLPVRSSSSGYSISKVELLEKIPMMESETLAPSSSHGLREKHFPSRSKQRVFCVEDKVHALPKKPLQQKPSVLSRIQFTKPVQKRKHEQQILSAVAPLPVPQTSTFSERGQFEIDGPAELDLSLESDVLVAKEIVPSQVSPLRRSVGEVCGVRTNRKNVTKDTSVSPSTSFSKSDSKVISMRTHKLKAREERFANLNPEGQTSKERAPKNKMASKVLPSSKSVVQNFDDMITGSRTPRNKVANVVSLSSDPLQNSIDRLSPMRMAEKKMAATTVALPDADMLNLDENVTSKSPMRKPAKESLIPQSNAMPNPSDIPALKTLKRQNSDGVTTTERCSEEKLAREVLVNSTYAESGVGEIVNTIGSTEEKLARETLVAQNVVSLHCNEKVAPVNDPKKEVLDNASFPSVPAVPNAEENSLTDRPKRKPSKDAFTSSSSVVNSDKKITTMRATKKKTVNRDKKKKVVASIAPCLTSMDPPGEIHKGPVSTNSSSKVVQPPREIHSGSITTHSDMEQIHLGEGKKGVKHSETARKVSTSSSSCEVLKRLEDIHAKILSGYSEGMASTAIRTSKRKETKRKDTGEFALMPCALDSCPLQEACERPSLDSSYEDPMYSKEVKRESISNCFHKDANCSEESHKDTLHNKVHQDRLDAEVHNGSAPADSCQDVGHLENICDSSTQITTCMDADFQGGVQDQDTFTGHLKDATHPVLLGNTETSDVGKLGVNNSTLQLHSQGIMSQGHLGTNMVEAPLRTVVPMEVDDNESLKKRRSTENAVENVRSSSQQEKSRGEDNVNFREGYSGSDSHLFAFKENLSPDTIVCKKVHDKYWTFFDGASSVKADMTGSNGEGGQILLPGPQSTAVLEEVEMVCFEKDTPTVLQVEVQTGIPELVKEGKQKQSPQQEAALTENALDEVGREKYGVEGEGSSELLTDVLTLPIESKEAVSGSNLPIGTNGPEGSILHLPVDIFPQSSPSAIRVECPIANSMGEEIVDRWHSSPLSVSEENSPEDLAAVSDEMHLAEVEQTVSDLLDNKSCPDATISENLDGDSNSKTDSPSDSKDLSLSEHEICGKSDLVNPSDFLNSRKTLPQQTREAEKQLNKSQKLTGKEKLADMNQRPEISKIGPSLKNPSTRTFKKPPSHSIRRNTWHRTENPPVSSSPGQMKWPSSGSLSRQSPKKLGKIQSSYIRKGNSLIRKSSPVIPSSHQYLEQMSLDQIRLPETSKNMSIEDKLVTSDHLNISSARTVNGSFERPKTPPLPLSTKGTHPSLNCPQASTEDPLSEPGGEDNAIPSVEMQCSNVKEENYNITMGEESKVCKKKLIYVKNRSNQLIAATGTDANSTSIHTTEESSALSLAPPDLYYRDKNKLIRDTSSSDSQFKQETSFANSHSSAKCHASSETSSLKCGAKVPRKRTLEKAMEKTYKQSRFSLVWTLNGKQSQNNKCSDVLKHQKVLPYLFPWKRTTCWRDSLTTMGSNLNKHSSPLIRKLQISRQRNTIYTISKSGFSLRKSGVLGVGGSHLKWSKSMEKQSRKASEEATLAMLEHDRKKRKQKRVTSNDLALKSGDCSQRKLALGIQLHQGERIFRIGTVRYKMDSSRRTLVRIPDEQTPAVANSQAVHGAKISIVPKRLSIGNDEYIRVGNGNQLVRDPKKLVRILANEKIRWSLHTARLRSVRKQQYCQFFTRFGQCNKQDGKCPYIHDPTKVAICTKFLKGLCSNPNCKLTHKVIPERMPDCSYFLQGLCTNVSCPYRHVNVNLKAPVCEGFLKGYCRDGDECRKKHSYVCPHFEASEKCPQGNACKLHHPKRANKQANKSRKRKRSPIHDHGKGRYFGCSVTEPQVFASNMDTQKKDEDIFFHKGRFAEFVSLDVVTDDGTAEVNYLMDSHPILMDADMSDSQSSDADAIIKPIRIMNVDRG